METKKIAIACFFGGVLGSFVALICTPAYFWLGSFAGFAGGYLSYEFREVLRAMPIAFRLARSGGAGALVCLRDALRDEWRSIRVWINEPHCFVYPAVVVSMPVVLFLAWWVSRQVFMYSDMCRNEPFVLKLGLASVVPLMISLVLVVLLSLIFRTFASIGSRFGERCYWRPFVDTELLTQDERADALDRCGYHEKPVTYGNVLRWAMKGVGLTVQFFVWTLWKELAIGIWMLLCFFGRFTWYLFKLIHSHKRVLCGADGMLGGMISYVWLISSSSSFTEQFLLVLFGGLLGAVLGVVNWELVSKRVLKVTASSA